MYNLTEVITMAKAFNKSRLLEFIDAYGLKSVRGKIVGPTYYVVGPDIYSAIYDIITPWYWKAWRRSLFYKLWWRYQGCKPYLFKADEDNDIFS